MLIGMDVIFGMRHKSNHVAFRVRDAGDVAYRTVGIDRVFTVRRFSRRVNVAKSNLALRQLAALVHDKAAFAVSHGTEYCIQILQPERWIGAIPLQMHPAAFEAAAGVESEGCAHPALRQETRFDQSLESVADTDHRSTVVDESAHEIRKPGFEVEGKETAGAQCIAVRETPGERKHPEFSPIAVSLAQRRKWSDDDLSARPGDRFRKIAVTIGSRRV